MFEILCLQLLEPVYTINLLVPSKGIWKILSEHSVTKRISI